MNGGCGLKQSQRLHGGSSGWKKCNGRGYMRTIVSTTLAFLDTPASVTASIVSE